MLTQRLLFKHTMPRCVLFNTHMKDYVYSTKVEIDPNVRELPNLRLSEHKKQIQQREPFVKNFFRGKYDIEFAAFPEPQTHDRHGEFFDWLRPIEQFVQSSIDCATIDRACEIPPEIIEKMKDLGVFRASVADEYNGLGLNYSEYAKLIETLSRIPSLGIYFAKRATSISLISSYASDAQKAIYLPQIASGKYNPVLCLSEDIDGSAGCAILTQAKRSDCDNFWILNGTKTYVMNGNNTNLFIVLAECPEYAESNESEETISIFLVEHTSNGITIGSPANTLGCHGLSLCEIHFKNTMIPVDNIIGTVGDASNSFASLCSNGKQNIGAQAIGITKAYLELLVRHMKKHEDFNAINSKNDAVLEVVGKICCSIYAMESVLYLTTGMMDTVANQDCDLENCIVESFCVDTCIQNVIMGSHILGLSFQLKENGFEQLMRDAISLISIDGTKSNIQSLIALMGIQYLGAEINTEIRKSRNPWSNPLATLKKILMIRKFKKLYIADNLHPTLEITAKLVEYGINKLQNSTEEIMMRHGRLVCERQMDLKRISDATSYLFVMAAVIARASRSYCLGMRDSEKEMKIAQILGYVLYQKVEQLVNELNDGNYLNGDTLLMEIADRAFENDAYFIENPFARNF